MKVNRALASLLGVVVMVSMGGCSGGGDSLGLIIWNPTGLAYKHRLNPRGKENLVFALGVEEVQDDVAVGHIDWNSFFNRPRSADWNPYWGVGADYWAPLDSSSPDNPAVSVRVPLGISYVFDGGTGDFFLELALTINEDTQSVPLALGIRFGL